MKTICIIGAGPSGLFCAHKILSKYNELGIKKNFRIIILENGEKSSVRQCPGTIDGICRKCSRCSIFSGGGGAGLFSDGKLIQDLNVGGHNSTVISLSEKEKEEYISYITNTLVGYDGVSKYKEKPEEDIQQSYSQQFAAVDLQVKYYSVLHMGSENLSHILDGFIGDLANSASVEIQYNVTVTNIVRLQNRYHLYKGESFICSADYVVMAVGKSGASWLKDVLKPLGVGFQKNGFYFGLRVEMPQKYLNPLAKLSFDPKIYRELKDGRKIKMHCFCRKGRVIMTQYEGYVVAGGHSPYTENNQPFNEEQYGNFNVLLSYPKTYNFNEMLERFKTVSEHSLLVQTLDDFRSGRIPEPGENSDYDRIIQMSAGNIRKTIQDEVFSHELLAFIDSLNQVFPGVAKGSNMLYGPSVEWCMDTVDVSENMETSLLNLFAVGDGAGLSQGIVYSASTGMIAAECIVERMIQNET
nr:hypothetical protein [uncultured Acetatifactor sp.]